MISSMGNNDHFGSISQSVISCQQNFILVRKNGRYNFDPVFRFHTFFYKNLYGRYTISHFHHPENGLGLIRQYSSPWQRDRMVPDNFWEFYFSNQVFRNRMTCIYSDYN